MNRVDYRVIEGMNIQNLISNLGSCDEYSIGKDYKKAVIVFGSVNCINKINKDLTGESFIFLELPGELVVQNTNTAYVKTVDLNRRLKYKAVSYCGEVLDLGEISYSDLFDGLAGNKNAVKLLNKKAELFNEIQIQSLVPLFYISWNSVCAENKKADTSLEICTEINQYSQLRYSENDIIFIKTACDNSIYIKDEDKHIKNNSLCQAKLIPVPVNGIIEKSIELHNINSVFLGNHQCYYRKENSEFEIEYKFNLEKPADPWTLIMGVYREIKDGMLPNYILEYKDEFQKWDYYNHLFEITGPEEDIGYISFIPLTNNKHLIKRKFYGEDQLRRREVHTRNVDIPRTPEDYLKEHYNVSYKKYPPFRRVRYDINLESLKSGNVFGIFFDHISVEEKDNILMQCEIEYLRTRSLFSNELFMEELNEVLEWTKDFLNRNNISYTQTFYSKLSYLRDTFK